MRVALKRTAITASIVACMVLLSFSWSEQHGVSLGVESALAQTGQPSARRHYRRSGDELFAAAVAATTSPWNYDDYFCYGAPYAGRGYPPGGYYYGRYPGGYCVSLSGGTVLYARPTLFPRYYGGWGW